MDEDQAFAGFSIHCSTPRTFQRMLPAVRAAAAESGHSFLQFADFVYLGLKVPATQNAVNCWLKRSAFHDTKFQVCFHLDETSAVIGLSTTMVPKNKRRNCWHFFPPPSHPPDIQVAAESPVAQVDVAVVIPPFLPVGELRVPTEVEYKHLFRVVFLTPLLDESLMVRLAERTPTYVVEKFVTVAEHCNWYQGRALSEAFPDCLSDFSVDIKVLPVRSTTDTGKARLVRELFTLEQLRLFSPHVIRIADLFTAPIGNQHRLHLVFEHFGIPLDQYRELLGFDRCDAQPSHHICKVLLHIGGALDHLHSRLGLVHASVCRECILVEQVVGSPSGEIVCRLGGFTSLEEASTVQSTGRRCSLFCFRRAEAGSVLLRPGLSD